MTEAEATWRRGLPAMYAARVVAPQRFAEHVDDAACACKLNGYDHGGRRCFVRHDHTATIDTFDIDELPLEVAVRHERRTAWRLADGRWLLSVDCIDRLDSCKPSVVNRLQIAADESMLGL